MAQADYLGWRLDALAWSAGSECGKTNKVSQLVHWSVQIRYIGGSSVLYKGYQFTKGKHFILLLKIDTMNISCISLAEAYLALDWAELGINIKVLLIVI